MKWTRETKCGQYAPFVSEDGKYRVQDLSLNPIGIFAELKKHNWDNEKSHKEFLNYCKEHKIKNNSSNWVLVDNKTNEIISKVFSSAKSCKEYAEQL